MKIMFEEMGDFLIPVIMFLFAMVAVCTICAPFIMAT